MFGKKIRGKQLIGHKADRRRSKEKRKAREERKRDR